MGSEDATTCHVVVLRHTGKQNNLGPYAPRGKPGMVVWAHAKAVITIK